MPKPKQLVPYRHIHTTIPKPLSDRLDLFLWSDLEQRVPQGAFQQFLIDRLNQFFNHRTLDIAPYVGCTPGVHLIQGPVETLRLLQQAFINQSKETENANASPI